MRLGIIGAGYIGRALARHGVANGHEVLVSNSRGPDTLHSIAGALGCQVGTPTDAAAFGEVLLVAIPFKNIHALPVEPFAGKTVLDANNYYPARDGRIPELDARQTTTSEMLARHLSRSRVVKAFNAILAEDLENGGRPPGTPGRRALPLAGDDAESRRVAARLVDQFGFDPVDVGPLSEGWRFERGKPGYCLPLDVEGLHEALAAAQRDVDLPTGSWRKR
jgi:8-hydroxy-5-deazaflavin:NADPH oxidoreductase